MVTPKKKNKVDISRSESMSQRAYNFIRDKVVEKKYRPGEPILESSVSEELGISRTPVREALKLLQKENLVEIYSRRGAFITSISLEKVREIYQLREIIEGEVARIVAPHIPDHKLLKIEEKLNEIKEGFDQWDNRSVEKAVKTGQELHELILDTLGNETLIGIMDKIEFDAKRGCNFASSKAGNVMIFLEQHLEIIKALKEKDGEKAKLLLNKHIRDAKEAVI
jgi:DNA-binding GntR family transcriptional regulator